MKAFKECSDCRTMMNREAPYCDACGYTFPRQPYSAEPASYDWVAFVSGLAIIAGGVALAGFLWPFN